MKFLALLAFSLIVSGSVQADGYAVNCSNSDGTVSWEEGNNSNSVKLVYKGFVQGVLELGIEQVNMKLSNQRLIAPPGTIGCGVLVSQTYTANVEITPADKNPEVFQSYFPNKKITATVICDRREFVECTDGQN